MLKDNQLVLDFYPRDKEDFIFFNVV